MLLDDGIFKTVPIDRLFVIRLFKVFSCDTVVLYLFAIEYRVSPFCTVYIFSLFIVGGVYGIPLYSKTDFITASASSL